MDAERENKTSTLKNTAMSLNFFLVLRADFYQIYLLYLPTKLNENNERTSERMANINISVNSDH